MLWTVMLEKTLESLLDCKEIKPVNPKGNQPWLFIERTDVEVEAPILWPPDANSGLIRKHPDAGKDWRHEEKGTTEDEMVGWHQWLNGHGFEQASGVGDGQGGLVCCSPWGRKESDMTGRVSNTIQHRICVSESQMTVANRDPLSRNAFEILHTLKPSTEAVVWKHSGSHPLADIGEHPRGRRQLGLLLGTETLATAIWGDYSTTIHQYWKAFWNPISSLLAPGNQPCPPVGQHQPYTPPGHATNYAGSHSGPTVTTGGRALQSTKPRPIHAHQHAHSNQPCHTEGAAHRAGNPRAHSSGDKRGACPWLHRTCPT